MMFGSIENIRDAVEEATSDLRAHNYALVLTAVELMLNGIDPNDAIVDIAHKSGEDEDYVRRLTMLAIREALERRV